MIGRGWSIAAAVGFGFAVGLLGAMAARPVLGDEGRVTRDVGGQQATALTDAQLSAVRGGSCGPKYTTGYLTDCATAGCIMVKDTQGNPTWWLVSDTHTNAYCDGDNPTGWDHCEKDSCICCKKRYCGTSGTCSYPNGTCSDSQQNCSTTSTRLRFWNDPNPPPDWDPDCQVVLAPGKMEPA